MVSYTTLDSFEHWNPNIQSLADRLLIGPQRDLLQKVHDFNNSYDLNINVTRTYRWSPGYMDDPRPHAAGSGGRTPDRQCPGASRRAR